MHYTFIGHATHLFQTKLGKIVVDPFFTNNPSTDYSYEDIRADYILVTHGHFDHVEDLVAMAEHTQAKVIANFEIVQWLKRKGLSDDQLHPQHIGGGFQHPFGYLKFIPAIHGSGLPDGTDGGVASGFLIHMENKKIYLAGDTALFTDMQLLKEENIDLMIVPIGDNFTMGPKDALKAVQWVGPKMVVPCHYNTWPLIEVDAPQWAIQVTQETPSSVHVLNPGASLEL